MLNPQTGKTGPGVVAPPQPALPQINTGYTPGGEIPPGVASQALPQAPSGGTAAATPAPAGPPAAAPAPGGGGGGGGSPLLGTSAYSPAETAINATLGPQAVALQQAVTSAPAQLANLDEMKAALDKASTGPAAGLLQIPAALAAEWGLPAAQSTVALQEFGKLAAGNIVNSASQAGLGQETDYKAGLVESANAGIKNMKDANYNIIALGQGAVQTGKLAGQLWQKLPYSTNPQQLVSGGPNDGKPALVVFQQEVAARMNPLAMSLANMTHEQPHAIPSGLQRCRRVYGEPSSGTWGM